MEGKPANPEKNPPAEKIDYTLANLYEIIFFCFWTVYFFLDPGGH